MVDLALAIRVHSFRSSQPGAALDPFNLESVEHCLSQVRVVTIGNDVDGTAVAEQEPDSESLPESRKHPIAFD